MHTIKLTVADSVYGHIMFLLKNLNTKEIKIVEDKITTKDNSINFSNYKVKAFKDIEDPVKWQQDLRKEWDRSE